MPDDECALARDALKALDEAFTVFRAQRDAAGTVVGLWLELINPAAARWLGQDVAALVGQELGACSPDAVTIGVWELIASTAGAEAGHRERVGLGDHPRTGTLEVALAPFGDDRIAVTCRDITERVNGERLLSLAYEQTAKVRATLQTALDATTDAFAVFDVLRDEEQRVNELRLVMINAAGAAPLEADPEVMVGWELHEVHPGARSLPSARRPSRLWQAIEETLDAQVTRTFRAHEDDHEGHWVASWDTTIAPVGQEQVVLTWRDVTVDERRERDLARAHDQAWHAATHDTLTGLANRALLTEQMREALWQSDDDTRVAVVYVDLDRFKPVNDTLGHAAGDDLLRAVAGRLAGVIRTGDLAARVGGDEFVLLLRNVRQEWNTERFLQRVRAAVEQPVLLADAVITPQASYGIVISPPASGDIAALLHEADSLMYRNKLSRR